ncbi:hypothetical protein M408DRAFT_295284 [Serendipita vermifera MAFF 305830]|uniref:C2H2-type domain-containing protein n=1 Tax=Serendipita vermifera MAFF 305830 TaxID=933852 RepID=A0A0C2XMN4_SERVB|nr:hypothetical protein M408DRAFT_295284 [Serendipita vermifera MAFF 305830]
MAPPVGHSTGLGAYGLLALYPYSNYQFFNLVPNADFNTIISILGSHGYFNWTIESINTNGLAASASSDDSITQSNWEVLFPALNSAMTTSVKNAFPYPFKTFLDGFRPGDNWQEVLKRLLQGLGPLLFHITYFSDQNLTRILQAYCEQELYLVERKSDGKTLNKIHCRVNGCTKEFLPHNVACSLFHHITKNHWKIRPFNCIVTNCHESFQFKHDRNRHEKNQPH